jgi:hypothetical protein
MRYASPFPVTAAIFCLAAPSFGQSSVDKKLERLEGLLRHEPLFWSADADQARAALGRLMDFGVGIHESREAVDELLAPHTRRSVAWTVDGNRTLERRFRAMVAKRIDELCPTASSVGAEAAAKIIVSETL